MIYLSCGGIFWIFQERLNAHLARLFYSRHYFIWFPFIPKLSAMKKKLTNFCIFLSLVILTTSCAQQNEQIKATAVENSNPETRINHGKYLVTVMGCNDCHSPKIMGPHGPAFDSSRLLSGHPSDLALPEIDQANSRQWVLFNNHLTAAAGPWGVSFAANITSDETGIGNWTEKQFFKAIREGKYKGLDESRMLLPPMPWPGYANATDEDLRAIFSYLKSTKPIKNVVPQALPPGNMPKQ
jgi:hypothetical protein